MGKLCPCVCFRPLTFLFVGDGSMLSLMLHFFSSFVDKSSDSCSRADLINSSCFHVHTSFPVPVLQNLASKDICCQMKNLMVCEQVITVQADAVLDYNSLCFRRCWSVWDSVCVCVCEIKEKDLLFWLAHYSLLLWCGYGFPFFWLKSTITNKI